MIIDDLYAIVGSANINDRSIQEIEILTYPYLYSKIIQIIKIQKLEKLKSGKKIRNLRMKLFNADCSDEKLQEMFEFHFTD